MSILYITDFHAQVKSKPKLYGQKIHTACKMIDKLLKRKDIQFKESDVIAFENFCSSLKHLKGGAFAGKSIKLEPHQKWAIACVLGIKQFSEKYGRWLRYFKEFRYFVARKEGKSLLMSLLGIWGLCFDFEQGAEVYCQASKKEQARLVFDNITKFIKKYPQLKENLKVAQYEDKKIIRFDATDSILTYMSAGKRGRDGQSPSMVLNDEIHEWGIAPYQTMTSGLGARLQPLIISMSTAGLTKNSLYQFMYSQIEDMCEKKEFDDNLRIFFAVFEIDADDDPNNKKCWVKANPGLISGRVSLDYLEQEYSKAKIGEIDMTTFISKHLNRSCDDAITYFDTAKLKQCVVDIKLDDITDQYVWCGDDLAEFTDFANHATIIPKQHRDNPEIFDYYILQTYYAPENRLEKKSDTDKVIYKNFLHTKSKNEACVELLKLCPGDIISFKDIANDIKNNCDKYQWLLRKCGYDKWHSGQFLIAMNDVGFAEEKRTHNADGSLIMRDEGVMTEVRQGKFLSDMIKWLKTLIDEKRIFFDRSNVLFPMCCANAKVSIDKDNLLQVEKRQSNGRIDGLISVLIALRAWECDRDYFIKNILPWTDSNKY